MKLPYYTSLRSHGFSLVELMVTISIIGILVSVIGLTVADYLQQGRDVQRQSDLQNMKAAIERYRMQHDRYPQASCGSNCWADESDISYIRNMSDIMPRLPRDPGGVGGAGYSYRTNADGTVFKLMSRGSVEQTVSGDHPLQSCDPIFCGSSCRNASTYASSYAVWGGFADDIRGPSSDTAAVICAM